MTASPAKGAPWCACSPRTIACWPAPEIARQYGELKAEAEARSDVEITTATEVTEAEKATLTAAVARKLGRAPEIQWAVKPELIAGALIRSGDTVIDGSFAAGLEGMRLALTR